MVGWSLDAEVWEDELRQGLLLAHSPALALGAAALVGLLVGGDALAPSSRWTRSLLALFFGHAAIWLLMTAVGSSVGYGGDDPSAIYQWGAVSSVALPATAALVLALSKPRTPAHPVTNRGFLITMLSVVLGLCTIVLYLAMSFIARSSATTDLSASSEIANEIAFGRGDWLRADRYREIGGWVCHNSCGKQYVPPPGPEILRRRGRAAVPAIVAVLRRVRVAETIRRDSDLESLDRIGALLRLLELQEGEEATSELREWHKDKDRYAALLRGEPAPI